MLVISNHARTVGVPFPPEAVVRINVAWMSDEASILRAYADALPNRCLLDYPTGRTKPPRPYLTLEQTLSILARYPASFPYFAFSNAEDPTSVREMRARVPEGVQLVPKIETLRGVAQLGEIVGAAKCARVLLDAEDLYIDCRTDVAVFEDAKARVVAWCAANGVECLRLRGVIFG